MAKITHTKRGFALFEFEEDNGNKCSLQKSSSAMEDKIWLGSNKIGIKEFVPFRSPDAWQNITKFDEHDPNGKQYVANNRMHLTREQVKELLPLLQKFVETGDID